MAGMLMRTRGTDVAIVAGIEFDTTSCTYSRVTPPLMNSFCIVLPFWQQVEVVQQSSSHSHSPEDSPKYAYTASIIQRAPQSIGTAASKISAGREPVAKRLSETIRREFHGPCFPQACVGDCCGSGDNVRLTRTLSRRTIMAELRPSSSSCRLLGGTSGSNFRAGAEVETRPITVRAPGTC